MARSYTSQLRTEQVQATRLRILEAAARVLSRPLADFSIPAVAEEAEVAVATVYRHFKTKKNLVDRRRLMELAVVLSSSATRHSFEVLLGASPARAADVVAWTIRRLAVARE